MKYFLYGILLVLITGLILFNYTYNIFINKSIFSINSNYNTYLFSNGNEIMPPKFKYTKISETPINLLFILLWSEDRDFFGHPGFNLKGFIRAIITNIKSGTSYGGSTITQQVVKNIYLTQKKLISRKILEIFISFWVERSYTKNEILESYINIAYLGNDINGFGAAAKRYFGKELRDLNLSEISILVGIINAPEYYNPYKYPLRAKNQALIILNSLLNNQLISKNEYKVYTQQLNEIIFKKPYFDENNFQLLLAIKNEESKLNLNGGGYIVKSTIDKDLFETVKNTWQASQSAIILDNKTGKIISFFGNQYDVFYSNRQIGSTIKPFYYLLALNKGFNINTVLRDEPLKIGNWAPQNFEKTYKGKTTLKDALIHSINIPSINLFLKLENSPQKSISTVESFLKEIGINGFYPHDITISLGTIESNVFNIAKAFSIFPNYGLIPEFYIIEEIYDKNGNLIYKKSPKIYKKIQNINNKSYSTMNDLLKQVVIEGTAKNLFAKKNEFHGKTGTAESSVWFSGYDAKIVLSIRKDGRFLLSTTHAIPIARKILNSYYSYNPITKVPNFSFYSTKNVVDPFETFISNRFNNKNLYFSKKNYIENIQNYETLFPDLFIKYYNNIKSNNFKLFEFDKLNIQKYINSLDLGDTFIYNDFVRDKLFLEYYFPDLAIEINK
ncbi:Membrane carboxypeptidase (penicillin-binding protein) [Marinitoga hydrogenitolerans DSM 16785]|uniref:peptidoglycan glycosyltransferase n=1 Tax=Marinitoga hydrogenitolerans (strain DSM 16785 / JCM 12826 / AT1271) TaxID=1122195 RepID=A0A1M4WYV7_MARH1|nr:transglycosylase domain-containing protein [Marinitoga hydrogenitolerans]SHE86243.1 Membrane carboxypeptidase (penicillin-binding protein) [Marinitoga hydrogenitolerans DSM 16785]